MLCLWRILKKQEIVNQEAWDKRSYECPKTQINSTESIRDLGLMFDSLQELSELRLDFWDRNMHLYRVDSNIKAFVHVIDERSEVAGIKYKTAKAAAKNISLCEARLHKNIH